MREKIKVSVIVPIYNTAQYLRKCLDSLRAQTLDGIEFILVDDGSTDASYEIAKEYARADARFKAYRQPPERLGQYQAVNDAIGLAVGEYIAECDSDDWVDPKMYKTLYDNANGADVVMCGLVNEYGNISVDYIPASVKCHLKPQELSDVDKYFLINRLLFLPSGIYKRSFILSNGLFYREGTHYDDNSLSVRVRFTAKEIYILPDTLYHYRKDNPNAGSFTDLSTAGLVEQWDFIVRLNEENGWGIDEQIKVQRFYCYIWQLKRLSGDDKFNFLENEFKEACKEPAKRFFHDPRDKVIYERIGRGDFIC